VVLAFRCNFTVDLTFAANADKQVKITSKGISPPIALVWDGTAGGKVWAAGAWIVQSGH
jgi:hypothetical protein